jgi:hypothetical protein
MLVYLPGSLLRLYSFWALLSLRSVLSSIGRALAGHLAVVGRALGFPCLAAFAVGLCGVPRALGWLTVIALLVALFLTLIALYRS